jgi:hypothetical protein
VGEGWLNACLSTNPWGSIYSENKRLEYPFGLEGKLHLMNDSLVWLPLRHIRHNRTNHLLLHFHMTSTMMPHAPPAITPPPVLRQNWEILAWLASRRCHPTFRSSDHRVPDLCLTILDPLHQVSYSYLDPHCCPPYRTCHVHITRQANMILHINI